MRELRLGFSVHRVTIKIICKSNTTFNGGDSSFNILNKVWILQSVIHPCIINLEDVIDMSKFLYIMLELAEGRELFDIKKTKLKEAKAKLNFLQYINEKQCRNISS